MISVPLAFLTEMGLPQASYLMVLPKPGKLSVPGLGVSNLVSEIIWLLISTQKDHLSASVTTNDVMI